MFKRCNRCERRATYSDGSCDACIKDFTKAKELPGAQYIREAERLVKEGKQA